jgi:hypothetical protein
LTIRCRAALEGLSAIVTEEVTKASQIQRKQHEDVGEHREGEEEGNEALGEDLGHHVD